jgi:hypothetical protein
LVEAIRSGKRYRRKAWAKSFWVLADRLDHTTAVFSPDDVLAEDWELEEPRTEVTPSQVRKAIAEAFQDAKKEADTEGRYWAHPSTVLNAVLKRFGFEVLGDPPARSHLEIVPETVEITKDDLVGAISRVMGIGIDEMPAQVDEIWRDLINHLPRAS